jgi:hypothetical protein
MISLWNERMFKELREMNYTNNDVMLPSPVYTFKYRLGDVFMTQDGGIIEITGYNYLGMTYAGKVTLANSGTILETKVIYEGMLNKCQKFDSLDSLMSFMKKDKGVTYRIHYVDLDPAKKNTKEKVNHTDITMTGIRALARMLNSMRKRNPNRRIVTVSVINEQGIYVTSVKFLPEEIKRQEFLTGMKERLLAHAKYNRGYEVAIGF